jgi:beta-mannosidase
VTGTLQLGGIATLWNAWIDGNHVASGDNMYLARELELAAPARELVIRCRALDAELATKRPRARWRVPMLEHQQLRWFRTTLLGRTPGWSPPCPAVGPWRGVWSEPHAPFGVDHVALDARVEGSDGIVETTATLRRDGEVASARLVVSRGGERFATELASAGDGRWTGRVALAKPALWWPHSHGEPARYDLAIEVTTRAGETLRVELGTTGFRTVELDRGADQLDFAVRVNGVPVFCRGACWTPLDAVALSAPAASYDAAIAQVRAAGMNMVRVGGTMVYEDDALYDALDAHGVLLWQDLMFANMDYPDDEAFVTTVVAEVDQELARLQARPCLAIVCGNSEGQQQAAMAGAARERWAPPLFHATIPARVRAILPAAAYVPSSTDAGAFPHQPSAGASSYYGVGAYMRPIDDARRAEVRFASECLAFANIPSDPTLPRVHHPQWKARSPRDLGAGWDFDDVRDHYVHRLYGLDPVALRVSDHERYLAIGRATTGEVMAQAFAEWRRARSTCRGALIWFLRDLWPGAGWGVVDAHGAPKPAWYALRRVLAPQALAITDEGTNGLAIHAFNDAAVPLAAQLEVTLYRGGDVQVGHTTRDVTIPAHGSIEVGAASLFDGFFDLSFAYRFGPPIADVVYAALMSNAAIVAETFWFPAGVPSGREVNVGLAATVVTEPAVVVTAKRFAQTVVIDAPGYLPRDNYFHLAPGQSRRIELDGPVSAALRGTVTALNSEVGARFEAPR